MLRSDTHENASVPSLKPVVILVFAAKLAVATLLVAQASLLPVSPVTSAYGLNR
jgi:hypothetical protein